MNTGIGNFEESYVVVDKTSAEYGIWVYRPDPEKFCEFFKLAVPHGTEGFEETGSLFGEFAEVRPIRVVVDDSI